jgi:hypothetical protein
LCEVFDEMLPAGGLLVPLLGPMADGMQSFSWKEQSMFQQLTSVCPTVIFLQHAVGWNWIGDERRNLTMANDSREANTRQ